MSAKHTPEPWGVWLNPDGGNLEMITDDGLARHIVYVVGNTHEAKANGRRIVACVNACAGINPEAVPNLLEAAKDFIYKVDEGRAFSVKSYAKFSAAIAKAEDNG